MLRPILAWRHFAGQLTIIERNGDSFIGIADLDTRVGWFRDA
jgi:hypothetical protein